MKGLTLLLIALAATSPIIALKAVSYIGEERVVEVSNAGAITIMPVEEYYAGL